MSPRPARVLVFRIRLEWPTPVWRDIEIRDDQTLVDLHKAIQEGFQWYDDHLYAFFMSGREWNSDDEMMYSEPESLKQEGSERENEMGADIKLSMLRLTKGKKIAYVYDFGDNLGLKLRVKDVSETAAHARYPRTIALLGYSPEEYHYHHGYSKEVRRELNRNPPKIVKLAHERDKDVLKQWSDNSRVW
jgi:hypothetical protein